MNELVSFIYVFPCSSSFSYEWVPSLTSIAPVHSAVNEPSLTSIAPVQSVVNELVSFIYVFHCSSSFSYEWVPSLTSIAPVHSAVKWTISDLHCPCTISCEWASVLCLCLPLPQFIQLWVWMTSPLWPPLPQFTHLWMSTLSSLHCHRLLSGNWKYIYLLPGLYCPESLSCEERTPSLASFAPLHIGVGEYFFGHPWLLLTWLRIRTLRSGIQRPEWLEIQSLEGAVKIIAYTDLSPCPHEWASESRQKKV